MNVLRDTKTMLLAAIVTVCLVVVACVGRASEEEIEAACQRLEALQTAQSQGEAADRLNKCRQDLGREKVTSEAAQCRAKAADLDTFWNKCR